MGHEEKILVFKKLQKNKQYRKIFPTLLAFSLQNKSFFEILKMEKNLEQSHKFLPNFIFNIL